MKTIQKEYYYNDLTVLAKKVNQNKKGASHNINSTSKTNRFICPNDGYVYIAIPLGGKGYVYVCDYVGTIIAAIGTNSTDREYHDTLFVKAGMQLYVSGNNEKFGANFFALTI